MHSKASITFSMLSPLFETVPIRPQLFAIWPSDVAQDINSFNPQELFHILRVIQTEFPVIMP